MKLFLLTMMLGVALLYGQRPMTGTNGFPPEDYRRSPANRPPSDVFAAYPGFAARIQKLLGAGTTPQQACDGFKKLGECVAAIHASQNLGIPLADLKARMTGKSPESLEKAIHELKPDLDAKAEKKKAQKQADRDMPAS